MPITSATGNRNAISSVSVTVLTKNSASTIRACLESLRVFTEVIVLDNGSEDRTLEIAQTFPNVRIFEHPFIGFGPMKNLAAQKATYDWILSIDSDEVLSPELQTSLARLDLHDPQVVYALERLNHYRGRPIRCCGWYPDRVLRLYNRRVTGFTDAPVHESLRRPLSIRTLTVEGELLHYPFNDVASLIDKMQRYSDLWVKMEGDATPAKAFFHAVFAFVKHYVFQRGFLCGYPGLLISVSNANGVFYKYMKRYEKRLEKETP
ncbi:glycosyltransferase family 2 protein [Nitratifractor sp.]